MAKKKGRKKRRSNFVKWGPTRRIDGKTFKRAGVHSRKQSANAHANKIRKSGDLARVLGSSGSYAVYAYENSLTKRQEDIATEVSQYRYGKAKSSQIKSALVWDEKDEPKVSKDVLELEKQGILEKTEPKGDIEPTWKLTKKGREYAGYDPHDFDE